MANYYLINLSVHPYIRKYLLNHYNEPFFVTERGYLPVFLENALERPPKMDPAEVNKIVKIDYGSYFGVAVGAGTFKKRGCFISGENVRKINEAISDMIHEEMYRMVVQSNGRFQVDETIRDFLTFYSFTEDELPFDNVKRWFYRERIRIAERRLRLVDGESMFTFNMRAEKKPAPPQHECIIKKIA